MESFCGGSRVYAGLDYSMYLSANGDVYSWGTNIYENLGVGNLDTRGVSQPRLIEYFKRKKLKINKIVLGNKNWVSFFRTEGGDWYCCGFEGFLGLFEKDVYSIKSADFAKGLPIPQIFFNERKNNKKIREVLRIVIGGEFALFNLKNLQDGTEGLFEIGYKRSTTPSVQRPESILERLTFFDNKKIAKISCGDSHFFVIDSQGKIYCSGGNNYGELGIGESTLFVDSVIEQSHFSKNGIRIKTIECLDHSSFFLSARHKIYGCGYSEGGRIGTRTDTAIPVEIKFRTPEEKVLKNFKERKVDRVFCGRNGAFVLMKQPNGEVWRLGTGFESSEGERDDDDFEPRVVSLNFLRDKDEKIVHITAGQNHMFLISSFGYVYGGGSKYAENDEDEVDEEEKKENRKICLVPFIERISAITFKRKLGQCSSYKDVKIITKYEDF